VFGPDALSTPLVFVAGDHEVLRIGPVSLLTPNEDCKNLQKIAADHGLKTALENQQ
jgi:hypothetical protein